MAGPCAVCSTMRFDWLSVRRASAPTTTRCIGFTNGATCSAGDRGEECAVPCRCRIRRELTTTECVSALAGVCRLARTSLRWQARHASLDGRTPVPTRRKPGRQRKYSNHAIETTVTLGLGVWKTVASRPTEGFLRSLLTLLNLDNDVPDHSTKISRRKARLGKVASYERRTVKPVHLRIDSSGLSVHVGQWRTPPKARDYRKLHLAVDEQTSDVVACDAHEQAGSRRFPGGVTRRPDRASHRLGQGRRRVRHRRRL